MSDSFNVFHNNGITQPVFGSTNTYNARDELDISDIFQEYFHDIDDPLASIHSFSNAYNEYAAASASIAQQQQLDAQVSSLLGSHVQNNFQSNPGQGMQVPLPTGRGIKTAWHAGSVAVVPSPAKKIKTEENIYTPPADIATSHNNNFKKTGSALSDRLGFNLANIPGNASLAQNKMSQPTINTSSSAPTLNKVNLPVGIGIRFGRTTPSNSSNSLSGLQQRSSGNLIATNDQNANGSNTQWGTAAQQSQVTPAALLQPPPNAQNPFLRVWSGLVEGKAQSSEKAAAERRHRNREHAKRSRVRKKFLLESLQQQVTSLQKENLSLRMIVQTKIPGHAQKIISESCVKGALFDDSGKQTDKTELVKSDFALMEHVTTGQQNFVLSDPRLPDNPIVYASEGFFKLTGYTREQVLGRNCRFLQGPGTDPKAVDVIRTAVANGTDATTCILNYKADGTPFWNQFFIAALRDSDNCIVNYVGVQCEIEPDAGASALEDKVNAVLPLQIKEKNNDCVEKEN